MNIQVHYDTICYCDMVSTAVRTEEQVPCLRITCEIFINHFFILQMTLEAEMTDKYKTYIWHYC
jgi:hypothetical protein